MTDFTSEELAKRLSTNDSPESWDAGGVVVSTGVGLGTTLSPDVFTKSITVLNFSDIVTSGLTDPTVFIVEEDETNDGLRTQYFWDGTTLMWMVAVESDYWSSPGTPVNGTTTDPSAIVQTPSYRFVSDAEKATWNGKQDAISTGDSSQYFRGDLSLSTFATDVRGVVLTGLSTVTSAVITAADSVLSAFGKLQAQVSARFLKAGDTLTGTGGSGYFGAIRQSSKPSTPADGFRLYADASGRLSWIGENGFVRTLDGTANTADQIYTFPNYSGTMSVYVAVDTFSNIATNYPAANYSGARARATDIGLSGADIISNGTYWVLATPTETSILSASNYGFANFIWIGGSGATYSQSGTTVTVTWTAHGLTADNNGAYAHLTQSTGLLTTGWFSNWTYVDANTFTVTSSVSQPTSGNLGANTSETYAPTLITIPTGMVHSGVQFNSSLIVNAKNSAGTKTPRVYAFGALQNFATRTTSTTWTNLTANQNFVSTTQYYGNGQGTLPLNTLSDYTYKTSGQLTSGADWMQMRVRLISWFCY